MRYGINVSARLGLVHSFLCYVSMEKLPLEFIGRVLVSGLAVMGIQEERTIVFERIGYKDDLERSLFGVWRWRPNFCFPNDSWHLFVTPFGLMLLGWVMPVSLKSLVFFRWIGITSSASFSPKTTMKYNCDLDYISY